ncbi:MAG: PKD domain-containing protein [Flavobacteriales bacterium]|jgi:gliding motility-associated-like protein|nr:PKD domain-containing protein [Flavobacteriales bacterium]
MVKKCVLFLLVVLVQYAYTQSEGNNWYFGSYAGLSFSTTPPTVLNNGRLTTSEGSAAVSGKDGRLVFYTDGRNVWDENHNLMPNGTGLFGNPSSTQSAVICPKPATYNYTTKRYDGYYIVTIEVSNGTSAGGVNAGVRYTEVDMTLNGGMGDVVAANKNIHLFGTTTIEGANVAKHANGCDYWIIGKEVGNTNMRAYHVKPTGVDLTPVISASVSTGVNATGSIKVSPNSKLVSVANGSAPNLEVFDFNNATGVLTTKFTQTLGGNSYSSEFSPNNNVVYFTGLNNPNIYQYDLLAPNQAAFVASQTIVGTTANTVGYRMCGLQLAPNGKIYAALQSQTRLGVINNPNILGVGANYDDNGISIAGVNTFSGTNMYSILGLPAFPAFFVAEPVRIKSSYLCYNETTNFKLSDTTGMLNVDWFWEQTGTPLPSTPNSTAWEPTIQYAVPGDYTVLSVAHYPCFIDSIYDTITITAVNEVNLGNDTTLCDGATLTLDAGAGYDYYEWHNGDAGQTFLADTTGVYVVKVSNVGENLVENGDFEAGNVGFTSQYNYFPTGMQQGGYSFVTTATLWGANCNDHTTGTGNLMLVDAACGTNGVAGGSDLWCQTIDVSPNTDYIFSAWATNANATPSTANIGFFVNGTQIGGTIQTSTTPCDWQELNQIWNSGTNTSVDICVRELTMICSGADFAIDDIFFAPLCSTEDTINVVVGEIPVANFSLVDSCEYLEVNYNDLSTISAPEIINAWSWDIEDDGVVDYTTQHPNHTFTAGSYTTRLTITSALGCTKDTTMPVQIFPKPTANFTYTSECWYDSLSFVDASNVVGDAIVSYGWNFGETTTPPIQSTIANPYHTYTMAGSYTVSEIVATANGCLDTVSRIVEAFEAPIANFSTANVCQDVAAEFTDQSTINSGTIIGWEWDFGDLNYGTNQNETHGYFSEGTYPIELIVTTNENCKDTAVGSVTIYPMPQVAFSMQDECLEDAVTFTDNSIINLPGAITNYVWDFGDLSNPSNSQNPTYTYQAPGTYDVTLTAISNENCSSNLQQSVTIHPLPQVSFVASEVCVNEPPTVFTNTSVISSGSNITYQWNFGDVGGTTSTQESPVFNYGLHGDYVVTLEVVSDMGCVNLNTDTIKVKHQPIAIFTQDTTGGCAPICVNFASQSEDSTGISSWNWSFENGYGEGSNKYEGYCYENAGTYDVNLIVTNTVGCKDTVESPGLITTFDYPIADFSLTPDNTPVTASEITFVNTSTDAVIWMWNFDDGALDSVNFDPLHTYADTGSYLVELTVYNANGCSSTAYRQVIIVPIENVFVPTAFSPNGDGENDVLYVRGYLNGIYFSVYDRWGKKVFESNDESIGWDGTINGKPANEGVYMWYLQTAINGEGKKFKGDVSLMR